MNEQHGNMNTEEHAEPKDTQTLQGPSPLSGAALDISILAEEIELTGGARDEDAREKRHEIYRERIKHFILMNDPLSRVVFDHKETIEYLLRVVMNKPGLIAVDRKIQADYKNLEGHSVIMDIVAVDGDGVVYNVEIQQRSEGAVPERARYNAGMVDSKELHEGEDFTKLPNSFIIFITDKDETDRILSEGTIPAVKAREAEADRDAEDGANPDNPDSLYVHRIIRVDELTGRIFKDRQTVIYINSRMPAGTNLGNLMHDFHCENADDMLCEPIASRVRKIKESPEEVEHMCREMDRIYWDGEAEGARRRQVRIALNMINKNYPANEIVEMTELTDAEVQQLQERKKRQEAALQTA